MQTAGSFVSKSDDLLLYSLWNPTILDIEAVDELGSLILEGQYAKVVELGLASLGTRTGRGETWFADGSMGSIIQTYIGMISEEMCDTIEKIGIASLLLYMQYNVVGPFEMEEESGTVLGRSADGRDDVWILQELGENGEDMIGKIFYPEYLLLARESFDGLQKMNPMKSTWLWWTFRVACCTQYILTERSQILLDRIRELLNELEDAYYVSIDAEASDRALYGALHLEAANIFVVFGMVSEVRHHISKASEILGIDASLTGALGTRTVHQKDAHAQLVVHASLDEDMLSFEPSHGTYRGENLDDVAMNMVSKSDNEKKDIDGLDGDSDIYRGGPKLTSENSLRHDLTSLHQLVILSLCNYVKKSSSPDGTQPWELAAYTEFVLAQDRTEFLIRLGAYLEMARLEVQRSRTRERALISFEGIKEALERDEAHVPKGSRMAYAFTMKTPCRAVLWKEVGEAFVACGLIGAAIKMFESAELWDSLIVCYHLLQKNEIAENIVRKQLEVTPNDAKLLCTLGDLVDSDEYYHQAWEFSNHRSARAKRSLARYSMRKDDFETASTHWENALMLSPLHLEGWFSLGWCYMKNENHEKAVGTFTRLVQMDPDDGRAWNNLATVHMKLENWQEAFVAFGEASKHSRDIWQTWENYALVAYQLEDFNSSGRSLEHVVTLTRGERYNHNLLEALVRSLEKIPISKEMVPDNKVVSTKEEQLHNYVASILKKIAASSKGSGDPTFWKIYATYYSITDKPSLQIECQSKRVRALQTSDWHSQEDQFTEYAQACIDLGSLHSSSSTKSELSQSRMLLRNALHRSKDHFEDHEAYSTMEQVLEHVTTQLNS